MAESEELTGVLTIHQTEKPIVKLVELDDSELREEKQTDRESDSSTDDTCPDEASAAVRTYRARFHHPDFPSEIALRYRLTYTEDHDPRFDQLFSIRLHFNLTDDHYEELGDISVPCLFRERTQHAGDVRLKPRRPYPTILHASAIFTTQDGLSWHTILPDVHVSFQQTFTPLPAPTTWGTGGKLKVFEGLWDEICSESGEDGATSLFCCQLEEAALEALVEKHFLPYLISDPSHEEEEHKVLFFLPPRSHMLLKIRREEDAVHFDIATDNWQLLPHASSLLLTVTSSQEDR